MASRRGSPKTSKWSMSLTPSRSRPPAHAVKMRTGPAPGPFSVVRPTRLRRERRAASTARLGAGVHEREPARQPLLHIVECRAVEVQVALLVHNDLDAVDLELFVVRPDLAVELQRVREPRAPPTLHAHPQEDVFGQVLSPLELFDLLGRSVGQLDRHKALPSSILRGRRRGGARLHPLLLP